MKKNKSETLPPPKSIFLFGDTRRVKDQVLEGIQKMYGLTSIMEEWDREMGFPECYCLITTEVPLIEIKEHLSKKGFNNSLIFVADAIEELERKERSEKEKQKEIRNEKNAQKERGRNFEN